MLSIRINRLANDQLITAAAYIQVLPNRIEAARSVALQMSQKEVKNKLPKLGRPAKYLVVQVEGFGPVGGTIRINPQKSNRSSKSGYDRGVAASVFLTGRKGGGIISAKSGKWMKLRKESVSKGYPPYLKTAKLSKLKSNKDDVRKFVKEITLSNLRKSFQSQGFGTRGGVSRVRSDTPMQTGI
jgi:hypothetical protein